MVNIPHKIKQLENKLGGGYDIYYITFEKVFQIQYYDHNLNRFAEIKITLDEFVNLDIDTEHKLFSIKYKLKRLLLEEYSKLLQKEMCISEV